MISVILFAIHIVFFIFIFAVKIRKSAVDTFMNLGLIIIVFSVGWTISTTITKIVFPGEGFGENCTTDDISLLILSISEFFFYKIYYKNLFTEAGKEK